MFADLLQLRQSVRGFKTDPVNRESVIRCLEAARLAPSANNGQPWHFIVAADAEVRSALAQAARFPTPGVNAFATDAPVMVAVCETAGHRPTRAGGFLLRRYFPLMDLGMAVEHFCLQAAEEQLGTCILGSFSAKKVRAALKRPCRPQLLIALGHPSNPEIREKKRHSPERISTIINGQGISDAS